MRAQSLDHLVADELVEIGQRLGVEAGAQRPDDGEALLAGQPLQQVGEVGGVQRAGQAGDQVGVADGDRLADLGDQRVGELERRGGGFGVISGSPRPNERSRSDATAERARAARHPTGADSIRLLKTATPALASFTSQRGWPSLLLK